MVASVVVVHDAYRCRLMVARKLPVDSAAVYAGAQEVCERDGARGLKCDESEADVA